MIAIFFFCPESRYIRNYKTSTPVAIDDAASGETIHSADEKQTGTAVTTSPPSQLPAIPKKTFLQELKPWSSRHPDTSYLSFFIRPWPLLVYPAVIYSFLTSSVVVGWGISLLDTHPSIFQAPPYNMTP